MHSFKEVLEDSPVNPGPMDEESPSKFMLKDISCTK